jgi:5-methylcytosine-specific restriction endonuclease McrA
MLPADELVGAERLPPEQLGWSADRVALLPEVKMPSGDDSRPLRLRVDGDRVYESRPPIPAPVKRAVRQRCGFGCVFCGLPFFQYDHMTDYSAVREHTADNLTLLCHRHHGEKTARLITADQVRQANDNPFALRAGHTNPWRFGNLSESPVAIKLAGVTIALQGSNARSALVVVNNRVLLGIRFAGRVPLMWLTLANERGETQVGIEDGELVVFPSATWDFQQKGRTITLRSAPRHIELEISMRPPGEIDVTRATLRHAGRTITAAKNELKIDDFTFSSVTMTMQAPTGGICVGGTPDPQCMFYVPSHPR